MLRSLVLRSLVGAAAVVLALGAASQATASWPQPPATDEGMLAAYLPVAVSAWPDSPCSGREIIHLHGDDVIGALHLGADIGGYAVPSTCEVWLPSGLGPVEFCTYLTHELGHLATGIGHTETGVMRSHGGEYPPCENAVLPAPGDRMGKVAWTIWNVLPPWLRGQAQITCGRSHCLVRGPSMRTRRYAADPIRGTASGPAYPTVAAAIGR